MTSKYFKFTLYKQKDLLKSIKNLLIWIFKIISIKLIRLKSENYILLARLISSNATIIDIKTGAQAATKGFKVPLTPSELEKKDKI